MTVVLMIVILQEAVKTLNTLQSNAQTLERIRKERDKQCSMVIPKMISFIERAGMSVSINSLFKDMFLLT